MNAESTAKGSVGWVGFNTYTLEIRRTLIQTNLPPPQKDDNYENDNFAAYFASAASNRLISLIIYVY